MVELRAVWVSRFDWTSPGTPAQPAKIDEIVQNVADSGLNVIFFQVRGAADAYYAPGLEPWAQRVSGSYGVAPDPFWDPLAYFIDKAHAAGLELHAYLNVLPVWDNCPAPPPDSITPLPLYHQLTAVHGITNNQPNGLLWVDDTVHCDAYMRFTPASDFAVDHFTAVATDLATRYDIDGLHLDHIRYARDSSCDPVSLSSYGSSSCLFDTAYHNWQRQQINQIVQRIYEEVLPLRADLWLSATAWPIYIEDPAWGWGQIAQQGYYDYYQDSKSWLANGIIDSISPMIYPGGDVNCPDDSFWTIDRFQILVDDFQHDSNGRYLIPGIGSSYCTFSELETRIQIARQAGTAGHALFSYQGLLTHQYFDDLAHGPYAIPAIVPDIPWHP